MSKTRYKKLDFWDTKFLLSLFDHQVLIREKHAKKPMQIVVDSKMSQELGGLNYYLVRRLFEWEYGRKPKRFEVLIKWTKQVKKDLKEAQESRSTRK